MTLGILTLLICIEISGCNQISNLFLTDEDKLIGTWTTDRIWFEANNTVIEFFSNGTLKIQVDFEFPIDLPIDISPKGKWEIKNRLLMMEIIGFFPAENYTYQFTEDNKILEITEINSSNSFILRKQ